jgi:arylsulfatase A-like enzyme
MTLTRRAGWALGIGVAVAVAGIAIVSKDRSKGGAALPSGGERPAWADRISAKTRAERPDILFVVYDARRRDDFSFGPHGNRRGDTPFLDAFARSALFFPRAVAPGCWTAPVHAAMFSGLGVCELGNDYYNPGFASFPSDFHSLAEVLAHAGYDTAALTDHPYFFNPRLSEALVRGFRQFDVINDFQKFEFVTNIGTRGGEIERRTPLLGLPDLGWDELRETVARFDRGEEASWASGVDVDPETGLQLARLGDLYRGSEFFERRYRRTLDEHVLPDGGRRPFFLFLNLHMADVAQPDRGLVSRWLLRTVLLNVRARRARLLAGESPRAPQAWLGDLAVRLGMPQGPFPSPLLYLKHVFDNRFYDASFESVWSHLERRGLTRNLLTVVTSDHGMSFREHGEDLLQHGGARPFEYITSVPLLMRFPPGSEGERAHGTRTERVSLLDLFPTLVEVGLGAGVFERGLPVRGRSLLDRIRSNDFERTLVSECSLGPTSSDVFPNTAGYAKAVYDGDLKLIHAPRLYGTRQGPGGWPIFTRLGGTWTGSPPPPLLEPLSEPLELLYDLGRDPKEMRNLARERTRDVDRLKGAAGSWTCEPLKAGGTAPAWDPAALETLRTLGYVR